MLAIRVTHLRETLNIVDIDEPVPAHGEVRIAVEAAALNFGDLLLMDGRYQERPDLPFTLGMELCGRVEAVGPGADGLSPGRRVAAYCGTGALAQKCVVAAAQCVPVPDGLDPVTAAAVPIAYGTSDLALFHRARLAPGETALITGAAGGVGLTAVELAARAGARVIACARGAEKCALARRAGAAETIDLGEADADSMRERVRALGRADVLYDTVGGSLFEQALRAMNPGGRAIVVGFAGGEVPQVRLNHLLVKNIDVIGYYWGAYRNFAPGVLRDSLVRCLDMAARGEIVPHVGLRLPLERTEEGYDALRARRTTGKVVIEIG